MERRPIFDAVRQMLGRGFHGNEVQQLDAAIDRGLGQVCADGAARRLSPAGIALIQKWEGCATRRADGHFEAYPDPGESCGRGGRRSVDDRLGHDRARYRFRAGLEPGAMRRTLRT